ncbi:hypothetical protein LFM09_08845 [Lentzea alba]|uniref:hypothetical protein n=1 Tax=Lentzea alba TaxID=2714351 RepID=UPI0039BEFC5D
MRWPGVLLALLLVLVGSSARHDAVRSDVGLNVSVSAVHALSVAAPDACFAPSVSGPRPASRAAHVDVPGDVGWEAAESGPWSSRAPPRAVFSDSVHP